MMAEVRRLADEAAQAALRASIDHKIRTGNRCIPLEREYERLERLIDMIDEHLTLMQVEDLDSPILTPDPGDHYAWSA
jgi:hypothetical protein